MVKMTDEQIKQEMAANSAAWHTADEATRRELEAANKALGAQLGASFDSVSGKWSDNDGDDLYDYSDITPAPTPTTPQITKPSNFTGSANNVVVNSLDQHTIQQLMNANSQAWWDADEDMQKHLHEQNVYLAGLLGDGVTFDETTGYWSGEADKPIKQPQPQQPQLQEQPQHEQLPTYDSNYSSQIDALLKAILNREEFSYDHTTDPSYLAYEQQYKRLGDRAREDTLGDVAGLTGGYASSWATSAASQAQNDYNQQLSNVIPSLREAAYNRYMDEYNKDVTNLGLVAGLDDTYYGRFRDTVADSKWAQEFDYNAYRDTVKDNQWQQEFDASNDRWNKDYELSKDQFNWNKIVDSLNMNAQEKTTEFNQMMDRWSMTGVADEKVAKYFGIPVGTTTESYYFNKADQALDEAKFAKSNQESDEANADYNATKKLVVSDVKRYMSENKSFRLGAEYLLGLMDDYGLGAADYYKIGAELGIDTSYLEDAFFKYRDEEDEPTGGFYSDVPYEVFERAMLLHTGFPDAESWYSYNYKDIPYEIREKLNTVLDDEHR